MNTINSNTLSAATLQALYSVYMYLSHMVSVVKQEALYSALYRLEKEFHRAPARFGQRDILRLNILKNALRSNPDFANSQTDNMIYSRDGLTACSFTNPNGEISVVFRGTGSGEWIDNGEGLSGIPEENTYFTYKRDGTVQSAIIVHSDYATDQQTEALNWFNRIAAQNGWEKDAQITVSGHSKGGNKAQFVAIHSNLVKACYSFDGHGFSPEALSGMRKMHGDEFEKRRQRIMSLSASNDYVNVLGERLMPEDNIYFFESRSGLHYMEALLDKYGNLLPLSEQGELSAFVEKISRELMSRPPRTRQYATRGIMNIFQKYIGKGTPVNGDSVSAEETLAGVIVALRAFLKNI